MASVRDSIRFYLLKRKDKERKHCKISKMCNNYGESCKNCIYYVPKDYKQSR